MSKREKNVGWGKSVERLLPVLAGAGLCRRNGASSERLIRGEEDWAQKKYFEKKKSQEDG